MNEEANTWPNLFELFLILLPTSFHSDAFLLHRQPTFKTNQTNSTHPLEWNGQHGVQTNGKAASQTGQQNSTASHFFHRNKGESVATTSSISHLL